jgi:hypothetical protein
MWRIEEMVVVVQGGIDEKEAGINSRLVPSLVVAGEGRLHL